jgi:hypothetical protein
MSTNETSQRPAGQSRLARRSTVGQSRAGHRRRVPAGRKIALIGAIDGAVAAIGIAATAPPAGADGRLSSPPAAAGGGAENYRTAWSQGGTVRLSHFSGNAAANRTIETAAGSTHPHLSTMDPARCSWPGSQDHHWRPRSTMPVPAR